MKNGPKYILKKVAESKLPSYVLNHPKVGFGMLMLPFFKDVLPTWFDQDIIQKRHSVLYEFVDKKFVHSFYGRYKNFFQLGKSKLWTLYALTLWLEANA